MLIVIMLVLIILISFSYSVWFGVFKKKMHFIVLKKIFYKNTFDKYDKKNIKKILRDNYIFNHHIHALKLIALLMP